MKKQSTKKVVAKKVVTKKAPVKEDMERSTGKLTKAELNEMFSAIKLIGAEKVEGAVIVITLDKNGKGFQSQGKMSNVSRAKLLSMVMQSLAN